MTSCDRGERGQPKTDRGKGGKRPILHDVIYGRSLTTGVGSGSREYFFSLYQQVAAGDKLLQHFISTLYA